MAGAQSCAVRNAGRRHRDRHLRRPVDKTGRGRDDGNANACERPERETAKRSFLDKAHHLRFESIDKLDERCPALIKERAELAESIGRAESPWVLAIINQTKRLAIERSKLRVAVIDQELSAISAARNAVASDGESIAAQADLAAQQRNVARLFRCVTKPGGTSSNMSSVGVGKCGSGGRAQSTQRWSPRETGNVMRRAHRSRGGTNWSMWRAEMRC
jgi:hypothetical protein